MHPAKSYFLQGTYKTGEIKMSTLTPNMIEKIYDNLPSVAREIINILAVYGESIAMEDMLNVLYLLKIKPSGKKRFTVSSIEQYLVRLCKVGFIKNEMILYFSSNIAPIFDIINYIAIMLEREKKIEQYYVALVGGGLFVDILSNVRLSVKYKQHVKEKQHLYFRLLVIYNDYNRFLMIYNNISPSAEFDVIMSICLDMFVEASHGDYQWLLTRSDPFVVCYVINRAPYFISICQMDKIFQEKLDSLASSNLAKILSVPYANFVYYFVQTLLMLFRGDFEQLKMYLNKNTADNTDKYVYGIFLSYYDGSRKNIIKYSNYFYKFIKNNKHQLTTYYLLLICFVVMIRFVGGKKSDLDFIRKIIKLIIYNDLPDSVRAFCSTALLVCEYLSGNQFEFESLNERIDALMSSELSVYTFFTSVLLYWLGQEEVLKKNNLLLQLRENARKSQFWLLVREIDGLLARLRINDKSLDADNDLCFLKEINVKPLVDAFEPFPLWQVALKSLASFAPQEEETRAQEKETRRLVWIIDVTRQFTSVDLKEQKITRAGTWSAGRRINPDKLLYSDYFDIVTPHDIYIASVYSRYHSGSDFLYHVIKAMIDHPLIFIETTGKKRHHVKVKMGTPELLVIRQQDGYYKIHIFPEELNGDNDKYILFEEDKITLYKLRSVQQKIVKICSAQIKIPEKARDELESVLKQLSHTFEIQSDLQIEYNNVKYIQASTIPLMRVMPKGDDLLVKMYVRPFGSKGPLFLPGSGRANIVANIDDQRCYTCRNLHQEKDNALQIVQNCQGLKTLPSDYTWPIYGLEASLNFLTEIYQLQNDVIVEWPEGEKYKLTGRVNAKNLRLKVRKAGDWFEVSGDVHINEDLVMELSELLSALRSSRQNFIMLDEHKFLALTEELRKKLVTLDRLGSSDKDKHLLHPLALPGVKDIFDELENIDADVAWSEYVQRLQKAEQTEVAVPEGLKARLRPYQKEGFAWLAKLDQWGVGACLSDDMGLGKTIQALTMILYKADKGPSLVVAPTSVCYNWEEEIKRFTPDLKPIVLGMYKEDRKQVIKKLQPFDVLICSYGLIQRDDVVNILKKQKWNIIVLDEAQHIKNPRTKRAKAVNTLKADFKIVTTGTPIENNLTDLWSIFRFINPGFLGSLRHFNSKFATPIEKYKDDVVADALKNLIQPFILRRTKAQVLKDLPPRTEITLKIELSEKERAFYEALRQEALSEINNMKGAIEQNRMHIFAMLTRLRRACCHPGLITPELDIPSSKLATLNELLDELRANNHRVLIFSQFTGHLQLIREMLQKKEISYQYLDGSTPSRKRQQAVEAFQAGQGDVFLISLKAGGTGLNLTAADYVIHMDPWWNPAVEDQASDRTHRIGQDKPVTIYRLVARDTIEEKIVELHSRKKDLAEKLLQGSDLSSKMKIEDVIALLKAI